MEDLITLARDYREVVVAALTLLARETPRIAYYLWAMISWAFRTACMTVCPKDSPVVVAILREIHFGERAVEPITGSTGLFRILVLAKPYKIDTRDEIVYKDGINVTAGLEPHELARVLKSARFRAEFVLARDARREADEARKLLAESLPRSS